MIILAILFGVFLLSLGALWFAWALCRSAQDAPAPPVPVAVPAPAPPVAAPPVQEVRVRFVDLYGRVLSETTIPRTRRRHQLHYRYHKGKPEGIFVASELTVSGVWIYRFVGEA